MGLEKLPGAGVSENTGFTTSKNDSVSTEKSFKNLNIGEKLKALPKEELEKLLKQADSAVKNEEKPANDVGKILNGKHSPKDPQHVSDVEILKQRLQSPAYKAMLKEYFSDEEIANLTPKKLRELDKALNESNSFKKTDTGKKIELSDISKKISAMSDEEIENLMKQLEEDKKSSKVVSDKKPTLDEMEAQLENEKAELEKQLKEKPTDDFLKQFISEAELKTLNSEQKKVLEAEYRSLKEQGVIE